jgi:hypothetical protein
MSLNSTKGPTFCASEIHPSSQAKALLHAGARLNDGEMASMQANIDDLMSEANRESSAQKHYFIRFYAQRPRFTFAFSD